MPNIFDGIAKMTDDEIRIQIAFFRNVTLFNVAKETSSKVIGGLADFANAVAGSFSKRSPFDFQVTKVSDMVRQEFARLKVNDRIQLEYELRKILMDKCEELGAVAQDEELTDERLSFLVLQEAAKIYNIQKYKTPANKLEEISISYNNTFLNTIHNRLIKQSKEEAVKEDQKIQDAMNIVPLETKRELQSALMPKEFSGRCIGRILRLERGTKYLSYTLTFLGYDCFDFVLSNVSAVYGALKTLKRVSRVLFAELVWSAKRAYQGSFRVAENVLPGYVPIQERQEYLQSEKEFREVLKGRLQAENTYSHSENALKKAEEKLLETQDKLELLQREYDECQMEFMGLESQKEVYISGKKPEDETKTYYNNVNDSKRKLDRAEADLKKQKHNVKEAQSKKDIAELEYKRAQLNLEVVKNKTEEEVKNRAQLLERKWSAFYFRFAFEPEIYERVIVEFTREEQLDIEELLKEMHDSRDVQAFHYELEEDKAVTYCHIASGKTAKVIHQKTHILQIVKV